MLHDKRVAAAQYPLGRHRLSYGPGLKTILRLCCIFGLLVLWQFGSLNGFIPTTAIASPAEIGKALSELVFTQAFWVAIVATLGTWAVGLGISTGIALPLGVAFGISSLAYRMFRNTIDFLRGIPPVALIPLVLLLFGATPKMAVALIVFGSVWPMLIQTMYGVHQVDPVSRDVVQSYRLKRRWVFAALIVPSATPFIATGFRIAATMSLLLTIGAQIIGGAPGIGLELDMAQQGARIANVYAYIAVCGVLGFLINVGLLEIERRALKWHPSYR